MSASPLDKQHPARCPWETVRPGGRRCVKDAESKHDHVLPGEMADDSAERILWLAREHGAQGDPDHEVGDLQEALYLAFRVLTPEQKQAILDEVEGDADSRR